MKEINEVENMLIDQIAKLNDDSIMGDAEQAKLLIDRSIQISNLSNSFVNLNQLKLDIVKELNKSGGLYESYLGIEEKRK